MLQATPTHICANADCPDMYWRVEADAYHAEIWTLSGNSVYTIAATEPFCPACRDALVPLEALEVPAEFANLGRGAD